MPALSLAAAIEIFTEGYLRFVTTEPGFSMRELDGIACLHYPEADHGIQDEFLIPHLPADEILPRVRALAGELPHWLTIIARSTEAVRAEYEPHGYQYNARYTVMERALEGLPEHPFQGRVRLAETQAEIDAINQTAGELRFYPMHLDDPLTYIYYLEADGVPVASGAGLVLRPGLVYIARMYTHPEHRRKGYALAILCRILHDAAAQGQELALLVATPEGFPLYVKTDFKVMGHLHVFTAPGWRGEESTREY
jgi:GNAT superfamily N-acetyltransferase